MSQERKKVERVIPPKPEPKKRVEVIPEVKVEDLINPDIAMVEYKRVRAKASSDKYVRYASSEYLKDKLIISEKIQKNEMKFAYFAIDGDDFYHYYILTK